MKCLALRLACAVLDDAVRIIRPRWNAREWDKGRDA